MSLAIRYPCLDVNLIYPQKKICDERFVSLAAKPRSNKTQCGHNFILVMSDNPNLVFEIEGLLNFRFKFKSKYSQHFQKDLKTSKGKQTNKKTLQ